MTLLTVEDLKVYFHTRRGIVRAVDGISYTLAPREVLGIVGESGSGKSVSAYSLLGLLPVPPGKIESGRALFNQVDLLNTDKKTLQNIRGNKIAMIFQDPMTSLNPYLTIGLQLMEPLLIHQRCNPQEAHNRVVMALKEVGISHAEERLRQYPHEFSGGMRQRVMVAMALIIKPDLLIADEPTTALDVTVQAQILELIRRLQQKTGMAVIFITHDLGVIAGLAHRILVMYAGKIVEESDTRNVFYTPQHPYTRSLLASIPAVHQPGEPLYTIPGSPPDLACVFPGCSFAARCKHATPHCFEERPSLLLVRDKHYSACMRVQRHEIE